MPARRAALVVAVVLATGSVGSAAGFPGLAPQVGQADADETGASQAATPGPETQNNSTTTGPTSEPSTSSTTDESAIRGLGDAPAVGRTGSGVVVATQHGRVLLRAFVVLNCTTLAVNATPEHRRYSLRLVYRDRGDGERQTVLAGPLNGTVTDPFGRTPLVLERVDLRFLGRVVLTRTIPAGCTASWAGGA